MHFLAFLYHQLCTTPKLPPQNTFNGQTIIISGANRGLGLHAAIFIAQLGAARLVLAVRNPSTGETAKKTVLSHVPSSQPPPIIEIWQLDLTSYTSVKAFAQRASTELDRIDVLLNNAGIATKIFKQAEDNESTITTNVISTFLLSVLMLPALRASAEKYGTTPRITIVGSEVHNWTSFPEQKAPPGQILETINNDKSTKGMGQRYFLSKLLVMLAVRALVDTMNESAARRAGGTGEGARSQVVLNCPAPGFVKTELDREAQNLLSFKIMAAILARTVEEGAKCFVDGAAEGMESQGMYLSECQVKDPSKFVLSPEGAVAQRRVWEEILAKLERIEPGVAGNI